MSKSSNDQNLLLGILALQMDFIKKDALIQAMNAWVLNKSRGIGEILLDQKALSPEHNTLLQALVQAHLKQHDNDAEKSLAAVSSVGSVREELQQIADPDVQASLIHVSAARVPDPDATAMSSVGQSTSSGQRFRILRPHAKGGLGQVSVAIDQELNRQVALKEIQDKQGLADDPNFRARFRLEAEINGGLEHPNIVPVYGLGTYADGRPYYAMRFIKGDSLKDAIERFHQDGDGRMDVGERSLKLRELLGRFVDVCNAIAYAHSRGVLHRDLKPGNIMLGPYGETLVVDWGLAKAVDRPDLSTSEDGRLVPSSSVDSAATHMGSALGTPAYMSPEQAAGQLDKLGAATDVYSLGATLYSLLTGKPAFTDRDNILQRVQQGLFPKPSQVKKGVPTGLEAICLKAMKTKPEDRYNSPNELAKDIERWLGDLPLSVYKGNLFDQALRWSRKNNDVLIALVTVGMLAVVVLPVMLNLPEMGLLGWQSNPNYSKWMALTNEKIIDLENNLPDNYKTWLYKGSILIENGSTNDAIIAFTKALSINPDSCEALYERAKLYRKKGQIELSIKDLKQALKLRPEDLIFLAELEVLTAK